MVWTMFSLELRRRPSACFCRCDTSPGLSYSCRLPSTEHDLKCKSIKRKRFETDCKQTTRLKFDRNILNLLSLIALWIARDDGFLNCLTSVRGCGSCVKRLKNVVNNLETQRDGVKFDSHKSRKVQSCR